ncbi:MAG: efflux RND transporter periplasmic adaptor subunit [bacterium]|nr:efflux RND transporter periplasmic adaptor subunit [bacterium]
MYRSHLFVFIFINYFIYGFGGPAKVTLEKVIAERIAPQVNYFATSLPISKSKISSTGQGLIVTRNIYFGIPVQKDQIVISLDTKYIDLEKSQKQAKLNQSEAELLKALNGTRQEELDASRARWTRSEARLKESSASLSRVQGLYKKSATTAEDLDLKKREYEISLAEELEARRSFQLLKSGERAEQLQYLRAKVEESKLSLQSTELKLDDMNIRAPFDGISGEVLVEVGDWINIGDPIAELVDSSYIDLPVLVPEEQIAGIRRMQKVPVEFTAYPQYKGLEGLVVSIGPLAMLQGKTIPVIVRVKNPGPLIAGMSARVSLPIGPKSKKVLVPKDAVLRTAGQSKVKVYVNQKGKAELRMVTVGQEFGQFIEVLDGLNIDDEVVTRGNERLRPGGELDIIELNKGVSGASQ